MNEQGVIKRMFKERGFGFIRSDAVGPDLYFHKVQTPAFDDLREGQRVSFTAVGAAKGPRAADVQPV